MIFPCFILAGVLVFDIVLDCDDVLVLMCVLLAVRVFKCALLDVLVLLDDITGLDQEILLGDLETLLVKIHINPNLSKSFQIYPIIYPNISKFIQIYPNLSKSIQICPNLSKSIQIYPNLHKCIQIFPNLSKYIQIYPNLSKFIQTYPSLFKSIQIYPNVS